MCAYSGKSVDYGTSDDPMMECTIGGVNVFGGGLAMYDKKGVLVGALGVSGDSSCADHNIAWKLRHELGFDYVPAGVSATKDDNIVNDMASGKSTSGWGHPSCSDAAAAIAAKFKETHPVRKVVAEKK